MSEELKKFEPSIKPGEVFGPGVESGDFEERHIMPLENEKRIHFADGTVIDTSGAEQIIYTKRENLFCISIKYKDKQPLNLEVNEEGKATRKE